MFFQSTNRLNIAALTEGMIQSQELREVMVTMMLIREDTKGNKLICLNAEVSIKKMIFLPRI